MSYQTTPIPTIHKNSVAKLKVAVSKRYGPDFITITLPDGSDLDILKSVLKDVSELTPPPPPPPPPISIEVAGVGTLTGAKLFNDKLFNDNGRVVVLNADDTKGKYINTDTIHVFIHDYNIASITIGTKTFIPKVDA